MFVFFMNFMVKIYQKMVEDWIKKMGVFGYEPLQQGCCQRETVHPDEKVP